MNDPHDSSARDSRPEVRAITTARDLARISSTLLASLIALMTFLLIVGVQTRVQGFTTELYVAVVLLGVGLVLFAGTTVAPAGTIQRVLQKLQQLVFVASVIAVVWFVISYGQLVIKPPETQQPQGASQQQGAQPQTGQPAQGGPAPGETAEQHAKETQQQPGGAQPAQPQPGQ